MNMYAIGRATKLCVLALTVGLSVANQPALAQTANFPPGTPKLLAWSHLPDWNGIWERGGDIVWDDSLPNTPGEPQVPPYNEQYMKEYQARRAEIRAQNLAGRARNLRGGNLYAAMPAMMIMLRPMDIEINPREVVIMSANGGEREIYTDGRLHPADALPSKKGHSIGHWEGKTLIVDTCCFKDDTRFPGGGAHSDAMHITERLWSPDGHSLKDAITVEDPKAFTKPWTTEKTYYRRPDWEQVEDDPEENTREFPGVGTGAGGPQPYGAQAAPGGTVQPVRIQHDDDKPYAGRDAETLQKATAFAVGNLAWETVKIVNVERGASQVKWLGLTRSARWRCTAAPDATKVSCESALAPAAVAAVPVTPAVKPPTEGPLVRNRISVDGRDRSYSYYVSSKADKKGFNFIVYALHDNGQTTEEFAERSGWKKIAEKNGFVVVFPEMAESMTGESSWATNSGGEDHYLKAVYDDASTHMQLPAAGAGAQNFGAPRGGADAAGGGAPPREGAGPAGAGGRDREGANAEGEGNNRRDDGRAPRVMTWFPFQYLTGVGAGGRVAQEFAIDCPGVYAAVATLNATPFNAIYAKGNEPAQGYFQQMRMKNAVPVWKQLKKDVPVAVWLFNSHQPSTAETKLADYWKHVDRVSSDGSETTLAGFSTVIYRNSGNAAQQVRLSTIPASSIPNEAVASVIWSDFFAHVARWTSSPNGDLGTLLTQTEVNASFDVRPITVDGKPYKYYLKRPSGYEKGKSLPLVISAHGHGYPAWLYLSQIKMHEVGEKEGFLTAYLEGPGPGWDFKLPDGADAQFVQKVIADVEQAYGADPTRIYMQGFSLGSGLSYMMGITHPRLFAAVSPNSGIGPMSKEVEARIADVKAQSDFRIPMIMVYGNVDSGGSVDGKIPAQGVIRGAFDEIKAYDHITAPDRTELLNSDNSEPYEVLMPGGKLVRGGVDKRYPKGRFEIYQYTSADPKPLNLFSFVWVEDMAHGGDPRQAQLEWDYFKLWHRNADGSLTYTGR
ncbi:MAG TPA: PHB depolymerase family esterase [Steroidobacteraceae bacterium]|nr:PHB depolymerase family esterase [Steroidobacteraceae bacterium]